MYLSAAVIPTVSVIALNTGGCSRCLRTTCLRLRDHGFSIAATEHFPKRIIYIHLQSLCPRESGSSKCSHAALVHGHEIVSGVAAKGLFSKYCCCRMQKRERFQAVFKNHSGKLLNESWQHGCLAEKAASVHGLSISAFLRCKRHV